MNWPGPWLPFRRVASVSVALKIVAVVLLLAVAAAAYHEVQAGRDVVISNTKRQMLRLDMVFGEQTARAIEAVDLLVVGALETAQSRQPDLDAVLQRRISGDRQLGAILVVDAAGQRVGGSDPGASLTPPAAVQALLTRYRTNPNLGVLISPPFRIAEHKWNVLLARCMTAPDGRLASMAVGSVNLDYFEQFYRAVELTENGAVGLHLRDGTMLARFPHVDAAIGSSFGHLPPFTEVLAHAQSGTVVMESPLDGTTRIVAIEALRAFPLAVMTSVEEGRVLAEWRQETIALVGLALLLGGAAVMLLLSLANRSRQVERLLDQSHLAQKSAEQTRDGLLQQIAERERAEGALRQAQRFEAVGQLTGGVAHDFNNLLTVVLGNVDMLQRRVGPHDPAALATRLSAIRTAAERGATLTGHLLAFARRQPLMPKAVDLNTTILGMQALLNSAMGLTVRTTFRLADDLWLAMVDQSQIELVILNLVINARDAMPDGGVVTIETANHVLMETAGVDGAPAGEYVAVRVRDGGAGIAADILGRVFEPFFTTKPPGAGSGLGLSQVFGTARQSGGQVRIDTEIGRGTVVTVDLPRAAPAAAPVPDNRRDEPPTATDAVVLLVDDDDLVRTVTSAMLLALGYVVRDAASGQAALTMLEDDAGVDLLLADLVMPGMNGLQLAEIVRARWPQLPICFISGYAEPIGDMLQPSDELIRKPFSPDDLYRTIELVLSRRRGMPPRGGVGGV